MAFTLRSPAFPDAGVIPVRFTCDGDDVSPPLTWSGAPEGTVALALVVDDPDAPAGTFTHWLLADLPGDTDRLAEGATAGTAGTSGTNDFSRIGYGGPCPPRGHGPHRYRFRLYALAGALALEEGFSRRDFEEALDDHVLGVATLAGTCARERR